jgi:hypothetical protein
MMSIANRFLASLCFLSLLPKDVNAQEVRDTISTKVTLVGPTVPIKKAVIAKNGTLTVKSFSDVVLEEGFEVKKGGELIITKLTSITISYKYDLSGNRTRRFTVEQDD